MFRGELPLYPLPHPLDETLFVDNVIRLVIVIRPLPLGDQSPYITLGSLLLAGTNFSGSLKF